MISVIIPCINEEDELDATIQSIRDTAEYNVRIVVVDDASHLPINIKHPLVKFHRNTRRCGAAPSRHIGALMAEDDWLLFIDCHSRFDPEWYKHATEAISNAQPNEVFCASCQQLTQQHKTLPGLKSYYGATLTPEMDGVWGRQRDGICEIPCVMGACYLVHRHWFRHIDPYRWLRGWGYEEETLSLKTWLAGGSVKLLPEVKIGHIFRGSSKSPHGIPKRIAMFNKLFTLHALLSPQLAESIINRIPHSPDKARCLTDITRDWYQIECERVRNQAIFMKDFEWLSAKFGL